MHFNNALVCIIMVLYRVLKYTNTVQIHVHRMKVVDTVSFPGLLENGPWNEATKREKNTLNQSKSHLWHMYFDTNCCHWFLFTTMHAIMHRVVVLQDSSAKFSTYNWWYTCGTAMCLYLILYWPPFEANSLLFGINTLVQTTTLNSSSLPKGWGYVHS